MKSQKPSSKEKTLSSNNAIEVNDIYKAFISTQEKKEKFKKRNGLIVKKIWS